MGPLGWLLTLFGGGAVVAAVVAPSSATPGEGVKLGKFKVTTYNPPLLSMQPDAQHPPRAPLPEFAWTEAEGEVDVASMARTPRFPPAAPGYVDVTLAELVPVGAAARAVTVFCDVLVTDATIPYGERGVSTATLVDLIQRTHGHELDQAQLLGGPTVHGERLVRDFRVVAGQLVGAPAYDTMAPIEHNDHEPPGTLRLYTGAQCTDQADPPAGWRAALQAIGFDQTERPPVLFHADKCAPMGPAYERRGAWSRYYNLNLEGRGRGVVLTARIARLPAVQHLRWRAVFSVRPD